MPRHPPAAALGGACALALLGGCANLSDTDREAKSTAFECDDDRSFLALFSADRRRAFVETDDETYELFLVDRDGDERTYTSRDNVRLTVDGDDGHLRIPEGDDFEDCNG